MMKVTISTQAVQEFASLPRPIQARVLRVFERLEKWPQVSGAKPLRGSLAGSFRIRTGDYRVQFNVESSEIVVTRVGHRDGFYD